MQWSRSLRTIPNTWSTLYCIFRIKLSCIPKCNSYTDFILKPFRGYKIVQRNVYSTIDSIVHSSVHNTVYSTMHSTVHRTVHITVHSTVHGTVHSTVLSTVHSTVHSTAHSTVNSTVDSTLHSTVHSTVNTTTHSTVESRGNWEPCSEWEPVVSSWGPLLCLQPDKPLKSTEFTWLNFIILSVITLTSGRIKKIYIYIIYISLRQTCCYLIYLLKDIIFLSVEDDSTLHGPLLLSDPPGFGTADPGSLLR